MRSPTKKGTKPSPPRVRTEAPPPRRRSRRDGTVTIEDAQLIFMNFQGKEGKYNREGDRNFSILLPEDLAEVMAQDGWNVKMLKSRDGEEPPRPYLQVSVEYGKGKPPRIVLITSQGRTVIEEDTVDVLDHVDIRTVDVVLNPYAWNVNGNTGIKAYLRTMFVTVDEDDLERKYAQDVSANG